MLFAGEFWKMDRPAEKVRIDIKAGALVLFAALLLLLPLQWVIGMLLAAAVHECFHALCVRLLGGRILRLTIGPGGAVMEATPMDGLRALACALAGPMGSLSLLFFSRWLPRTALCALVQGCYNLLPLLPLDGGNALSGFLSLLLPIEKADHIMERFQRVFCFCLLAFVAWLALRTGIWALFAVAVLLFLRSAEIKLAKKPIWRYNRCNIDKGVRL